MFVRRPFNPCSQSYIHRKVTILIEQCSLLAVQLAGSGSILQPPATSLQPPASGSSLQPPGCRFQAADSRAIRPICPWPGQASRKQKKTIKLVKPMFQIHWGGGSCIYRKHLFYLFYCFFWFARATGREAGWPWRPEVGDWRREPVRRYEDIYKTSS